MIIINVKNMADLLPRYPDYWIVGVERQPEFKYWGRPAPKRTQAWLWYNMEPAIHSETLTMYLWEKWGVTDHDEALGLVSQ